MYYVSTRDKNIRLTAAQAIVQGLSTDGGLLTPEEFPKLSAGMLNDLCGMDYQQRAVAVMKLFLEDFTEEELAQFAQGAYGDNKFSDNRVAPVREVKDKTYCLELWHGPTCAFKDMALQMLPRLLSASLEKTGEEKTACVLVATSGDTGKAALEGFRDVDQTKILVFYPKDGVSDIQQLQMTTQEGKNVAVCSVVGNFDDAQSGVKKIFSDEALRAALAEQGVFLSSANSINWGRVLPQIVYYVSAYCDLVSDGKIAMEETVNVCVPTGNFGNILAGYYAKKMGVPIGKLICASNANNVLTDFLHTGVYNRNRTFYNTISPSMDILISSNLERMLFELSNGNDAGIRALMAQLNGEGCYKIDGEILSKVKDLFAAGFCSDECAAETVRAVWQECAYLIDPHTAVAFEVLRQYREESGDNTPTIVVSTASPYKFCDSVLKALGEAERKDGLEILDQLSKRTETAVPAPLAALKNKSVRFSATTEKEEMTDRVMELLN